MTHALKLMLWAALVWPLVFAMVLFWCLAWLVVWLWDVEQRKARPTFMQAVFFGFNGMRE